MKNDRRRSPTDRSSHANGVDATTDRPNRIGRETREGPA